MTLIQGVTKKGNLTNCIYIIDDNKNAHCFSYGAAIIDGAYEEYDGPMFYSNTSCRHKAAFRRYFGIA